jgi:hypothetical protein
VQPALNGAIGHFALGQGHFSVGTHVVDGEDLVTDAYQSHLDSVDRHSAGLAFAQISQAHRNVSHH